MPCAISTAGLRLAGIAARVDDGGPEVAGADRVGGTSAFDPVWLGRRVLREHAAANDPSAAAPRPNTARLESITRPLFIVRTLRVRRASAMAIEARIFEAR